ncbi:MAG TPA: iron transporter [Gemmatimonadaceae bacterium]|nr:iron transporter [Gemmatimonadaceae bacterium]
MSASEHTPASTPPSRPSDEADRRQLAMAKEEGDAYQRSLRYMIDEVADVGGHQRAGDYVVGFAQERAEGMWHLHHGRLEWHEPAGDENCHLEVAVTDATDGRFVPYLDVQATLVAKDGTEIGPFEVPFVWHPGLYHYGRNIAVPGDGAYTLKVRIAPPTFHRHDEVNGKRYAEEVRVEFPDVRIMTGRE